MKSPLVFYQVRNMPRHLARGIRVAAALEDKQIWKWCVDVLAEAVKKSGVIIEEADKNDQSEED